MTHIDFPFLNSHVGVESLRFIKSANFYVVKIAEFKIAVFLPAIYPFV